MVWKRTFFLWSHVGAGTCAPISSLFLAIHVISIGPCFITIYFLSNLSFILVLSCMPPFYLFHACPLFPLLIYRRIAQHLIFIWSPLHFLFYLFYSGHPIFVWSFYFLSCMFLFMGVSNKFIFNLMTNPDFVEVFIPKLNQYRYEKNIDNALLINIAA